MYDSCVITQCYFLREDGYIPPDCVCVCVCISRIIENVMDELAHLVKRYRGQD